MSNLKIRKLVNKKLYAYLFGLFLVVINLIPFFTTTYIAKFDYYTQHIPFYTEFYRLIAKGLPFWSWNGFLGLNFYASKTYYLIGDIYAWLSVLVNYFTNDVPKTLSILLVLKFIVSYSTFYLLTKYWEVNIKFRILLSFAYTFSGWNLMFLEQVMFTSYYSLLPLLLLSLEYYFEKKNKLFMILSVALLFSTNFYFFWTTSFLFLFYFIFRYNQIYTFKISHFIRTSFLLIFLFVAGVLLSSIIWLPGVLHLIQSERIGTFKDTFDYWSNINLLSFISFTLIPNLRIEDGIFKDTFYYFNQVSMFIGVSSLLFIPQSWFIKKDKKEKYLSVSLFIFLLLILISPKIGLFFNFSYSLRYTIIHTLLFIFLASISLKDFEKWRINGLVIVQLVLILFYFYILVVSIPSIYRNISVNSIEIKLLFLSFIFSILYFIILYVYFKKFKVQKVLINLFFVVAIIEIAFLSNISFYYSKNNQLDLDNDSIEYLQKAINYIKSSDDSFYRIYTNDFNNYENLSYSLDFRSIITHDTMYQYSLQKFLHYTRQYPYIHWGFNLHDYSILQQVGVKYEIIKDVEENYPDGIYNAKQIALDIDFGPYKIYEYQYEIGFGKTYTRYDDISFFNNINIESKDYYVYQFMDRLNSTAYFDKNNVDIEYIFNSSEKAIYIQPTIFENNFLTLDFELDTPAILVLSMPYDKGWTIKDNGLSISSYNSQGGFMTLILPNGEHHISLKFMPYGFVVGFILTSLTSIALVLSLFIMGKRVK